MTRRFAAILGILLLALFCPALCLAADSFSGKVVGISDGDTISVLRDGKSVKVRLAGIDTPEQALSTGERADNAVGDFVATSDGDFLCAVYSKRTTALLVFNDHHKKAFFVIT